MAARGEVGRTWREVPTLGLYAFVKVFSLAGTSLSIWLVVMTAVDVMSIAVYNLCREVVTKMWPEGVVGLG